MFGPNTTVDWSREGRRPFPIFNRGTAFTAVTIAADKATEKGTNDNSSLPYPSRTRRTLPDIEVKEDVKITINDPVRKMKNYFDLDGHACTFHIHK